MRITSQKGESLYCEFHRIPLKTINYNEMKKGWTKVYLTNHKH
jgi:hypothetical protein